jgi:hypothetical protein
MRQRRRRRFQQEQRQEEENNNEYEETKENVPVKENIQIQDVEEDVDDLDGFTAIEPEER